MLSPRFSKAICLLMIGIALCALPLGCNWHHTATNDADPLSRLTSDTFVETNDSQQWSSWRGGTLGAVTPAEGLPVSWGSDAGIKWKTKVPGRGNSSPVVWNSHIFLTSEISSEQGKQIALICFRGDDGKPRWQRNLGSIDDSTHNKNGYASATVATDGQNVYSFFGSRGLFCHDFNGQKVWHVAFSSVKHQWGAASSPVLFGNLVIQVCDGQSGSFIAAYDKTDGRQVWRTPRDSQGCWSTPVIVQTGEADDQHWELIVNGTGSNNGSKGFVIAYDPLRGTELWREQGTTDIPCPTTIVGDNMIVSSSGGNGPLLAIRPGRLGRKDRRVLWRVPSGGPYVPTGLIHDDRLYTITDGGVASCYDCADGKRIWKRRLRGTFSASLICGEGKIYAVNEQGTTHVFAIGDQYESLATNRFGEGALATPAIIKSDLLLRSRRHLCRIGKSQPTNSPSSSTTSSKGQSDSERVEVASPSDVKPTPAKKADENQQ